MIWTLSDLKTMLSRDRDNDADWDASLRQILRRRRCVSSWIWAVSELINSEVKTSVAVAT